MLEELGVKKATQAWFDFKEIQDPFIEAVEETIEEKPVPKGLDKVFRKAIRFILQTLTKGYDEGKANDNPDVPLLLT